MKYYFIFLILFSSYCLNASEVAFPKQHTLYEEKIVQSIRIGVTPSSSTYNTDDIKNRLQTKEGSYFSQDIFDQDLKSLSENYFRIEPCITIEDGGLAVTLMLWEKPIIQKIDWVGNKYFSTKKLQKELDITPGSIFDRDEFNTAFNKLKELYIKRGYFESQLSFHVIPNSATNEITIQIHVDEGRCGIVSHLQFIGFTKEEGRDIMEMINAKRYRLLLC
ncbi:MAG: POTRA domain-containing protein, partial [Chlamydiales bacterium]